MLNMSHRPQKHMKNTLEERTTLGFDCAEVGGSHMQIVWPLRSVHTSGVWNTQLLINYLCTVDYWCPGSELVFCREIL